MMKLTVLLTAVFVFQAVAESRAQKITLSARNATLKEVMDKVQQQQGYSFFFLGNQLAKTRINVDVKEAVLADAMTAILARKDLDWYIEDKTIVIKRSERRQSDRNEKRFIAAEAQQRTVSGKVTDEGGNPLEGVTVMVKGTSVVAVTNREGNYRIAIPDGGTALVFTIVGYEAQERLVGTTTVHNVSLNEGVSDLDEVVIIGYGQVNKADLTGSVGVASVTDMQKAPVRSFEESLAGRLAGVQVTSADGQPGEELNIIIRGASSITGDNSPLYVIDGFPIENPDNNIINPNEIESITVLKDASAAAIYGARGANGVVIITTKSGKAGDPVINYNGYYGSSQSPRKVEVMNPYEFVRLQQEINPNTAESFYFSDERPGLESYRGLKGIDWQSELYRAAPYQNHDVSISGGTDHTKYNISGSLFDQKGIIVGSGYNRMQGRVKVDQRVNNKFNVGININYANTGQVGTVAKSPVTLGPTVGVDYLLYNTWGYRAIAGTDSVTNSLLNSLLDPDLDPTLSLINPIFSAQNELRDVRNSNAILNGYAEYKFSRELSLRVVAGATLNSSQRETFNNSNTRGGSGPLNGINGSINNFQTNNFVNENVLTYNRSFNRNNQLNVVGIYSTQMVKRQNNGYTAIHLPNESLGISGLDQGAAVTLNSLVSESALQSFAIRTNYTLFRKYLFTGTFRADGSSKFPPGNKWGYFPSAAFAWRLSDEDFFQPIKPMISSAKLRASYGVTGNNRVGDFDYLSQIHSPQNNGYYSFGNQLVQGFRTTVLGNSELKWESTGTFDAGLEVGMFKGRVAVEIDYYRKRTYDLLLNANLASSTGFLSNRQNIGVTQNNGLEITANASIINTGDFVWSGNFNISFNRNKILSLADGEESRLITTNSTPFYSNIIQVGQPIYQFYGYVFDGIYQLGDFDQLPSGTYVLKEGLPTTAGNLGVQPRQPGDPRYRDLNNDGVVNDLDRAIIGTPYPKHFGGFNNNFRYKRFDLNLFFQWSYGNSVYNANRYEFEGFNSRFNVNAFASYADRWTPTNPSNELIRVNANGRVPSNYFVEDASFLRLKTISLGYGFSDGWFGNTAFFKNARVYLSAQNIVTWTNYSGLDPEVSVNATIPGLDFSAYPRSFVMTAGASITF